MDPDPSPSGSEGPHDPDLAPFGKRGLLQARIFQAVFWVIRSGRQSVHAGKKYCFNQVFWQNKPFNQDKTVQFRSVLKPSGL
jgi:hypothetical protein